MDVDTSIEQVAGILVREDFKFGTSNDGRSYRLLFGSAAVFIHFAPFGDDSVVITVSSPVLQDIEPHSPGAAQALNALNELNKSRYFVRFTYDDGTLAVDYDLLGDTLQAPELSNAIYAVASAADQLDDELIDQLGGEKFETKLDEWTLELEDE